jgi:NitT/TauT family transport system permease protein
MRRLISVIAFLLLWELIVRTGVASAFLLSAPTTILARLYELTATGVLPADAQASMTRMIVGYLLALVSGVLVGGLMGWYRWIDDIVDPLVELVRPVSPLAILPLAVLWLGIGQASKIFVIWYACFFPILLNTYAGVRSVPKSTVEAAQILGASADEMFLRVLFHHCLPSILTGARISFAVGMIVIIAAEMIAADRGLGYMILTAQQNFQTPELYAGIATVAMLGFLGDRAIRRLKARICPWHVEVSQA